MIVRYAVVWMDAGGYLQGVDGPAKPFEAGWYLLKLDEKWREAFCGGPYSTAEEAIRVPNVKASIPGGRDTDSNAASRS